jgi:prolyl oligopeptidase PreP (S9A serine peptidase family)
MTTRQFVADGFNLPEAKSDISWEDENICWWVPTSAKAR